MTSLHKLLLTRSRTIHILIRLRKNVPLFLFIFPTVRYRVCEIEFSQMHKNSGNQNLVCKKTLGLESSTLPLSHCAPYVQENIIIRHIQCSPFLTICLGPLGMDSVISELCIKMTILQRSYRKMTILLWRVILLRNYRKTTIKWSFSYNLFVVKLTLYNTIHL